MGWYGAPVSANEGLPRLTPYLVPEGEPAGSASRGRSRPAVLICPGGGYARRAGHEGEPVARWLNGLGWQAFVLDYRVAPERHPGPLHDARWAMRQVRHRAPEWGVDPGRVAVLGFSAGGHLAATLSTRYDAGDQDSPDPLARQPCRPDATVLCYPVISFVQYPHLGSMHNLLGESPSLTLRRALSADLQVTPETPPAFLWHTAEDAGVPVENSLLYGAALARQGVPFALHVFPQGRHGLGLADGKAGAGREPQVAAWTGLCAAWLGGLGWR